MTTTETRPQAAYLTVSDIARLSGVAPSAVRFYEQHGLIVGERTAGNQRRFYEVTACVIKVIRVAQRVGLSIAEIRELTADLPAPRDFTMTEWFGLRQRLEDEVRARIQNLTEVLDDLTSDAKLCEVPPA